MATATKHTAIKDPSNNAVRVEIFDQPYNLRGSDAGVHSQAGRVRGWQDAGVAEQTHTVDTARLAVLAALNIADEYHLVKRNQERGSGDYLRRAQNLSSALDEVLEEKRGRIARWPISFQPSAPSHQLSAFSGTLCKRSDKPSTLVVSYF